MKPRRRKAKKRPKPGKKRKPLRDRFTLHSQEGTRLKMADWPKDIVARDGDDLDD